MKAILTLITSVLLLPLFGTAQQTYQVRLNGNQEITETGKFSPDWESLKQYQTPEWFKNAKFGIWAHWGPQCQPEQGDWYARGMYEEGSWQYKWHVQNYGHPSVFGFKDVINEWKAEKWNPEELVKLYKRVGARYFFAMGNHHDNMDLWDSKYQPWNSVNMGPKQDILARFAKAAKENDLPFGVSIHSAHAWRWLETAQRADKDGPYAGVPYDGNVLAEDGKGKWWEGYNPQELYAQNHPLSNKSEDNHSIHGQWAWGNGAVIPSVEYVNNFYDRVVDMLNKYDPDLLYFDDTVLPLYPFSDAGMKIAAHFYNSNMRKRGGKLEAVLQGKILDEEQRKALTWDVEKGTPDTVIEDFWQTCTCIGGWHYQRSIYDKNQYKSAKTVVEMLVDIVSKNGNLLLNIPVRGDGSIDDKEVAILEEIGEWMATNSEAIYDTRTWEIFGEGPVAEQPNPINAQGFNEGKHKPYTSADIRFTQKDGAVYAVVMAWPEAGQVLIKSLSADSKNYSQKIKKVEILGGGKASFKRDKTGLIVTLPKGIKKGNKPFVVKVT
jgi:alpha-L-fucosidase